jgi:hypothetical protein
MGASDSSRKRKHISLDVEPYHGTESDVSAFDNTVLRRKSYREMDSSYCPSPKKLQQLKNALGLYNENSITQSLNDDEHASLIYSILSATNSNSAPNTPYAQSGPYSYSYYNDYPQTRPSYPVEYDGATFDDNVEPEAEEEDRNTEKPYVCPVAGCDKSYKNPNGLKYHAMHGHCGANGVTNRVAEKPHKCPVAGCGKRYKNPNGLKYHITHAHVGTDANSLN